jgi:2-polyprenyl-3-methyl-5-hydroxy-6-metoxy-1,4-benzoquinol methylase
MTDTRIYGSKTDLDRNKVHEFWNNRLIEGQSLASVMLRQKDDDQAKARNEQEKIMLYRLLGEQKNLRIVDVGCGLGRWADNLGDRIERYHGIDGSVSFIA